MTRTHLLDLIAASSATVAEQIEIRRAFEAYCDGEWKREQDERETRIRDWRSRDTHPAPAPVVKPVTTALEFQLRRSLGDLGNKKRSR